MFDKIRNNYKKNRIRAEAIRLDKGFNRWVKLQAKDISIWDCRSAERKLFSKYEGLSNLTDKIWVDRQVTWYNYLREKYQK